MRPELSHRLWRGPVLLLTSWAAWWQISMLDFWVRMDPIHAETHSWGSARWRRDGWTAASIHIYTKVVCFKLPSPNALNFYLHFLSSTVCVRGWLGAELEGYNLEETWDPITDTNTQSPHSALPPPVSHMLVTAAGLSLPGTRHPACLSHSD